MNNPIISYKWNNSEDFLDFNAQGLTLNVKNTPLHISFSSLLSIKLDIKKKLAPLISGAIFASLAMVNILLEGASLSMIGLLSIGMLVLYIGLTQYWVITLDQLQESKAHWISKNKCAEFPKTLVNIIDYRVSKGFLPPFYLLLKKEELVSSIAEANIQQTLKTPLELYLTPPRQLADQVLLKLELEKLNQTLTYVINKPYLTTGTLQINKEAILNMEY